VSVALLAPFAALFALSLPLLVLLHMRRARTQALPITTLRFWEEAQRHRRQRLALRRPPRSLLLLLQLLIAALIVLALVRPALPVPGLPGSTPPRQLIIVLDRSAAMRATDVAPSRFGAAQERARALIRAASADEAVALLTLGDESQTFRAADAAGRAGLLASLDGLAAGGGRADLNGALPTLRALLLPERENRVVLLSGGIFANEPDRAALAALPATLRWEAIGSAVDNLAITTLVTRRSAQDATRNELFARVANYATSAVTARSEIEADGATVDTRQLSIAANSTVDIVWQLPANTRGARLRVTPNGGRADALPADNEAFVVTRDVTQRRILLVSDNPGDLGRALAAQSGVTLTTVAARDYSDAQPYDLTVFDRFVPTVLPRGGVLLINPGPSGGLLSSVGTAQSPEIVRVDRESAILAGVDLSGLTFGATTIFRLPSWATEVVGGQQGPLILAGNLDGREVAALAFDPAASSLTKRLAFPILIGNLVERLQTHRVPTAVSLGAGVSLEPVAGTTSLQLRDPSGSTHELVLHGSGGGAPTAYVIADQPGLYALIERDASGATLLQESFAVNGGDPVASNLRAVVAALPAGAGGLAPALVVPDPGPGTATTTVAPRRLGELWPVLLGLALAILVVEWIVGIGGLARPRAENGRVRARPGMGGPNAGTTIR
jgi:Ca-activated chloride channel family protein